MHTSMHKQRGLTLTGLMLIGVLLFFLVVLGMKLMPDVQDYFAVLKDAKATAQDPALRDASMLEIRRAFDKRLQIDSVSGISGSDLDITKQNGELVMTFAYTRQIPLFKNVSLVIDFEGSTARK